MKFPLAYISVIMLIGALADGGRRCLILPRWLSEYGNAGDAIPRHEIPNQVDGIESMALAQNCLRETLEVLAGGRRRRRRRRRRRKGNGLHLLPDHPQ